MTSLLTAFPLAAPLVALLVVLVVLRRLVRSDGRGHTLPPRSHCSEELEQLRLRGRRW